MNMNMDRERSIKKNMKRRNIRKKLGKLNGSLMQNMKINKRQNNIKVKNN